MTDRQRIERHLRSAMSSLDAAVYAARGAGHAGVAKTLKAQADAVAGLLLLLAWNE